jgi:hypothetical protein
VSHLVGIRPSSLSYHHHHSYNEPVVILLILVIHSPLLVAQNSVVLCRSRASAKETASEVSWGCPKCRSDYGPREVPTEYHCMCGKEVDPPVNPWLLPHTCGETCGRPLRSACGHTCVLLCHPGPCPPCPLQVRNRPHFWLSLLLLVVVVGEQT